MSLKLEVEEYEDIGYKDQSQDAEASYPILDIKPEPIWNEMESTANDPDMCNSDCFTFVKTETLAEEIDSHNIKDEDEEVIYDTDNGDILLYISEAQRGRHSPDGATTSTAQSGQQRLDTAARFNCDICGDAFEMAPEFKDHITESHFRIRPFQCDLCSGAFQYSAELQTHRLHHTGDKDLMTPAEDKQRGGDMIPRTGDMTPRRGDMTPRTGDMTPRKGDMTPRKGDMPPWMSEGATRTGSRPPTPAIKSEPVWNGPEQPRHPADNPVDTPNPVIIQVQGRNGGNETRECFKCGICHATFAYEKTIRSHMAVHDGNASFRCDICSGTFTTPRDLKAHMLGHSSRNPFKCNICSRGFTTKYGWRTHLRSHQGEDTANIAFELRDSLAKRVVGISREDERRAEQPGKCVDVCKSVAERKKHIRDDKMEARDGSSCCVCSQHFISRRLLNDHMATHCGDVKPPIPPCGQEANVHCLKCDPSTVDVLATHEIKSEPDWNIAYQEENIDNHPVTSPGRLAGRPVASRDDEMAFTCGLCNATFTHQDTFRSHVTLHAADPVLRCDICGETFTYPRDLKTHMLRHMEDRPFKCESCARGFTTKGGFRNHMRSHKEKTPGQSLAKMTRLYPGDHHNSLPLGLDSEQFIIGQLTHVNNSGDEEVTRLLLKDDDGLSWKSDSDTGRSPQEADDTPQRRRDTPTGRQAKARRRGSSPSWTGNNPTRTGPNPLTPDIKSEPAWNCTQQKDIIDDRVSIQNHPALQVGTTAADTRDSFRCRICNATFAYHKTFRLHMNGHSEMCSFRCDICSETFATPRELKTHVLCHSRKHPFKCKICSRAFTTKIGHRTHLRSHKGETSADAPVGWLDLPDNSRT